jgi:hypothetical protein
VASARLEACRERVRNHCRKRGSGDPGSPPTPGYSDTATKSNLTEYIPDLSPFGRVPAVLFRFSAQLAECDDVCHNHLCVAHIPGPRSFCNYSVLRFSRYFLIAWRGKGLVMSNSERILITGGAGFIGSHLAEAFLAAGKQVSVLDDLSTGRFENIQHLVEQPGFTVAIDSIANRMVLDRLASESDVIFHLAAAVGVQLIVEHPVRTIETNIMGYGSCLAGCQSVSCQSCHCFHI